MVGPGSKSTKDLRVADVRPTDPPPDALLAIPADREWNAGRIDQDQTRGWLSSLFKLNPLP